MVGKLDHMEQRTIWSSLGALALFICCAAASASGATATPVPTGQGDIDLNATIHIDSLRVETTGAKGHVGLSGVQNCRTSYSVRRINLPQHPRSGVTYRNVTIVLHAAANFSKAQGLVTCSGR